MQALWKTIWKFVKKFKIKLPYNPVIPFLGIYPNKSKTLILKIYATNVHHGIIYTSQDMKATQVSNNIGSNKEDWYIYAMEY